MPSFRMVADPELLEVHPDECSSEFLLGLNAELCHAAQFWVGDKGMATISVVSFVYGGLTFTDSAAVNKQ